ncbi:maltokinase N-terminal cap-like domain-containing protein [Streptomyces mauvecolor]
MTTAPVIINTAEMAGELKRLLPVWLPTRRWFAGKGRAPAPVEPGPVSVLSPGDPALLQVLVRTGPGELHQLLLGAATSAPPGQDVVGRAGSLILYEATGDAVLMGRLAELIAEGGRRDGIAFHRVPGARIPRGLPARPLGAEQSNTGVVYGEGMMLKVLRRPVPGVSHELEMLTALGRAEGVASAAPLGWLSTTAGQEELVLGIFQEFVPSRGDGWALALADARACVKNVENADGPVAPLGAFTEEARALGLATAGVHRALAGQLPTAEISAAGVTALVDGLAERLATAAAQVPELRPYTRQLGALYQDVAEVARRGNPLLAQRVHGDLHLGQALRAGHGWVLIDFEGEPGGGAAARAVPQPPLRDVAAMLRSFDYAAHHALAEVLGVPPGERRTGDPRATRQARRASAWAVHNRRAFSEGYTAAGGCDPRCRPVLLRAFEADKAVYEALYEARNRPAWLPIPMAAVRRLAASRRAAL